MDPALEEFKRIWAEEGLEKDKLGYLEKRPRSHAYAQQWLAAHQDDFTVAMCRQYNTIPQLVTMVDTARAQADDEAVVKIEMWILVGHEPQAIGATFPGGGA